MNKDNKSLAGPIHAVFRGFLIGLGIAAAHKTVDAADQKIRGDNSTLHTDKSDDTFGGFL